MELNLKFTEEEAKKIVGEGPLADLIRMCSCGGPDEAETPTPVTGTPEPAVCEPDPEPATVPTSTPAFTMEQLAKAGTQIVEANKKEDLLKALESFGVQALSKLPTDRYGEFAAKLRGLGAKI